MKNKNTLSMLFLLGIALQSAAQINTLSTAVNKADTAKNVRVFRSPIADSLNKPYEQYQKLLSIHDPILYLTFAPQFEPLAHRTMGLNDGEGRDGYWLEGNIAHRIVMYRGKYYSPSFLKKLRVTFDAAFTLRLTSDSSSPLLPLNDKVGFGADYLLSSIDKINKIDTWNYWVKAQIHHYSNGQASPFFASSTPRRNNYKNGDFSTNYFRVMFNGFKENDNNLIFSAGLGYQREINIGGPLTLSDELQKSYGLNNLLLTLQWHRKSLYDVEQRKGGPTLITKRSQINLRTEFNYILDNDLSLFPSSKKYRFGGHAYLTWYPYVTSDVGLVFHGYMGRDYLNIRYDDIIYSYQFGMVLNFN